MLKSTFSGVTTLSLTMLVYLHPFISCCCIPSVQNPAKFSQNSNLCSSRSSKVIDLAVNRKYICNFLLLIVTFHVSPTRTRYWRI